MSNGGLKRQTEQFYDVAGPSIMHQVMQTAAEATGQPAFVPPVSTLLVKSRVCGHHAKHTETASSSWQAAMPGAAFLSPQRTNTVSDPLWESDPPSSVEQVRQHINACAAR